MITVIVFRNTRNIANERNIKVMHRLKDYMKKKHKNIIFNVM